MYATCKSVRRYKGQKIECWYDEDANSPFSAWNAFLKGIGTSSAPDLAEAVAAVKAKFDKATSERGA